MVTLRARFDGIQHRPQYVALERERAHGLLLQRTGIAVSQSQLEAFGGVHLRLNDTAAEIVEAPRLYPAVTLLKGREPVRHEVRRKEFRQGRGNGNRPVLRPGEVYVRIHCKPDTRQEMFSIQNLLAV